VVLQACGRELPAPQLDVRELGGEFALTDHRGHDFSLAGQGGRVFCLFFGFTACREVCPVTLSRLAASTRILSVTVDPQRETPQRTAEYHLALGGRAIGLTGDAEQIRAMAPACRAGFQRTEDQGEDYDMKHSSRAHLIDQKGRVRYLFSQEDPPKLLAGAAAQLL